MNAGNEPSAFQVKQTLQEAAQEITSLRRQNEILRAKVEVLDFVQVLLYSAPAGRVSSMASPCVVNAIEKLVERMEEAKAGDGN